MGPRVPPYETSYLEANAEAEYKGKVFAGGLMLVALVLGGVYWLGTKHGGREVTVTRYCYLMPTEQGDRFMCRTERTPTSTTR